MDTARLPFTDAVVSSVSADKRTVEIKMKEPDKAEFDPQKYPWLVTFMAMNAKVIGSHLGPAPLHQLSLICCV